MQQSPSWEANWFSASQEIPRIPWNPKVHYRINKIENNLLLNFYDSENSVHLSSFDFWTNITVSGMLVTIPPALAGLV